MANAPIPYIVLPGAVAANTATAFPSDAPTFGELTKVVVLTEAAGGAASTTGPVTPAVITSGTPTGEQILLGVGTDGSQTWEYGEATTDGTVMFFLANAPGAFTQTS